MASVDGLSTADVALPTHQHSPDGRRPIPPAQASSEPDFQPGRCEALDHLMQSNHVALSQLQAAAFT